MSYNSSYYATPAIPTLQKPDGVGPQWLFDLTMDYRTPFVFACCYAVTVSLLNSMPRRSHDGPALKALAIVHNAALCVYSAWTFVNMASYQFGSFYKGYVQGGKAGLAEAFCDRQGNLFPDALAYFGYFFYLSKYYEVIDTGIILLKGKKSSLLQTYHHSGAILTMFAGMKFLATPIWIFAVFNSFIHTIMYFYFLCSCLHIKTPAILKRSLTMMQITQFLVGGSLAASYMFVPNCLWNEGQRMAVTANLIYLAPLTVLFVQFFQKSYRNMSKKQVNVGSSKKTS